MKARRFDMGRLVKPGELLDPPDPVYVHASRRERAEHQRPEGMPSSMLPTGASGRLWVELQRRKASISVDEACKVLGVRRAHLRQHLRVWIARGVFRWTVAGGREQIQLGGSN